MIYLYSKPSCPHCVRAKEFLKSNNMEFREINLSLHPDKIDWLKEQGCKTVPQAYFYDVASGSHTFRIGNCDDMIEYLKKNVLDAA